MSFNPQKFRDGLNKLHEDYLRELATCPYDRIEVFYQKSCMLRDILRAFESSLEQNTSG